MYCMNWFGTFAMVAISRSRSGISVYSNIPGECEWLDTAGGWLYPSIGRSGQIYFGQRSLSCVERVADPLNGLPEFREPRSGSRSGGSEAEETDLNLPAMTGTSHSLLYRAYRNVRCALNCLEQSRPHSVQQKDDLRIDSSIAS